MTNTSIPNLSVMVTGARAPAALEWARALSMAGVRVIAVDSVRWPITRFSNAVMGYERVPAANQNMAVYVQAINDVCERHKIDLIIPCCEEVFFLARAQTQLRAPVFAPNFDALAQVHNKYLFALDTVSPRVQTPHTRLLQCASDVQNITSEDLANLVLKPVWSRFASHTLVSPKQANLMHICPSHAMPWVAQERVYGRELCSYSVAYKGQVLAHVIYHPKYRAGQGAGIYFEPCTDTRVDDFVREFCAKHVWTGQVAFDFIANAQSCWVLECNPRATSGAHLLGSEAFKRVADTALHTKDMPKQPESLVIANDKPKQVGLAMLLFGVKAAWRTPWAWCKDFSLARDVIASSQDWLPLLAQPLCLLEMFARVLRHNVSIQEATYIDTQWNGQDFEL